MRRILIVEDEFLVRIGLKTTIDWKKYGCAVVGEASNGKEALQMFDALNPDILITDIKMPIMDGLELLAEVKKHKPDIQVVILSNYGDFEYAREAMHYGASAYLLKSEINEDGILKLLQSLMSGGDAQLAPELSPESTQEQYLRKYVHDHLSFKNIHVRKSSKEKDTFNADCYVAIRADADIDFSEEFDEDTALKNMESLLHASFDEAVSCCGYIDNRLIMTAIYPVRTEPMAEIPKCKNKVDNWVRNAKLYFDTDLHVGVSQIARGKNASDLFEQAESARMYCFFTDNRQAFFGEFVSGKADHELIVNAKLLREYVESANQNELEQYIGSLFHDLRICCDYNLLRSIYVDLLSTAKSIRYEHRADDSGQDDYLKFDYGSFDMMPNIFIVESYILDIYRTLLEFAVGNEEKHSYTIQKSKQYLNAHYAEHLSLDTVAKAVGISRSYLSMVFKQEMGINFSAYLTAYRIEMAKKLLLGSNMKIYEIAESVGFSTPYYFSKVFKEQTGMSCKEFKDSVITV